jgi:hypothetical protein
MKIALEVFKGLAPKVDPHLLPDNMAQVALNCRFISGGLRAWRNMKYIAHPSKPGEKKTIYLYDGEFWFHWTEDVDIVKGAVANDIHKRIYFTGETFRPQMTTRALATTGGTDYPMASFPLGINAPTGKIAVSLLVPPRAEAPITVISRDSGGVVRVTAIGHGLQGTGYNVKFYNTGYETLDFNLFAVSIDGVDSFTVPKITSFHNRSITGITKANPARVTSPNHGLKTGDKVQLSVQGMTQLNNVSVDVTVIDINRFTLDGINSSSYGTFSAGNFELTRSITIVAPLGISAITQASPAAVTSSTAHGLKTGDIITLSIPAGMTELDEWGGKVTVTSPTAFTLDGVDSTGYTLFTAGTFTRRQMVIPEPDPALLSTRSYVRTLVSTYGEEGPPCAASDLIDVSPGQEVTLSWVTETVTENITKQRIYRTNTGSESTQYQLLSELPFATLTFSDTVKDADLGEVLQSTEWSPPPATLKGLITLPNGGMCGFYDNIVCFCVPYRPHAWPAAYQYPVDFKIKSVVAFGTSVGVFTEGNPYIITGTDPGTLTPEKMEIGYANLSKRGTVDMGTFGAYPSPVGLMTVGIGTMRLATEGIFSQEEWEELNPSSIHAYEYSGHYVGFYDNGVDRRGFIFNVTTGDFSYLNFYATAGYAIRATGELYLIVNGDIVKFDAADSHMLYTWKSKPFAVPQTTNFSAGQIFADDYPVTLTLIGDKTTRAIVTVADSEVFRIDGGYRAEEFEVQLSGTAKVRRCNLAETVEELNE